MTQPVTVEETKAYLRLEYGDEDAYIAALISTAREICENFLRADLPEDCPDSVKQAMLLVVGYLYENRGEESAKGVPCAVFQLLAPYRKAAW